MRKTFPSKAHGRNVIGPYILSLQRFKDQKLAEEAAKQKPSSSELAELNAAVGKSIVHSAGNGLSYGKGIIVGVKEDNGSIFVEFENGSRKGLSYKYCLENGIIEFV